MKPLFSCSAVATKAMSSANNWDLHPFLAPGRTLFQTPDSIQRSGLMYLPLVRKETEGSYEIITGKRCVDTCNTLLPQEMILCRVLDEAVSMMQLLAFLYEEHMVRGALTIIEQAHFIRICRNRLSEPEQRQLFDQVGLPNTTYAIERLLELLELENSLQAALWEGLLTESIARDLLRLKREDRQTFFDLVVRLGFGGGKQRRLLSLLKDLAGRNRISFQEHLDQQAILAILDHQEMNIPQKGQMLLQLLQQLQSPALSIAEERFHNWKRQLDLPLNCSVEHSPSFEQDDVSLTIRFADNKKLELFLAKYREDL